MSRHWFLSACAWGLLCCALTPPVAAQDESSAAKSSPPPSYTQLADPEVAKRLELSDTQKQSVANLLGERETALADTDDEQEIQRIAAEYESLLAGVLNPAQRLVWHALFQPTEPPADEPDTDEPRLRFSFRFQPWADVLNYIAEQSGLSLVLDAPPPGTFNYTDANTYSIPEALDLINGVLSAKNYTLIRRQRMLMLIDLEQGIPENLIPQIPLEELDERGKYELVSVLFGIGKRNPNEVAAEIEPLLGEHGNSAVLEKTKQVLVTETAGKMKAISAIIESMPEPKEPSPPEKPAPPEKPVLAAYPLENVTGAAALEVLTAVLPETPITHDPKTDQIVVFAAPTKQAAAKATIEQMQADEPPEKKRSLRIVDVDPRLVDQLQALIATAAPEASATWNDAGRLLYVWGTPAEQSAVDDLIEQLSGASPDEGDKVLLTYDVRRADLSATTDVLRAIVPRAELTIDSGTRKIVAVALPGEHAMIRDALRQIDHVTADQRLVTYDVDRRHRGQVTSILDAMSDRLGGVQRIEDTDAGRLFVWATDDQHEAIADVVERVADGPRPDSRRLVVYPVQIATPDNVAQVLTTLIPGAQIIVEQQTRQVIAWATADEHALIATTVEQMDREQAGGAQYELRRHTILDVDATLLNSMLAQLVPDVQLVIDSAGETAAAWARKTDHDRIADVIARLRRPQDDANAARVAVFDLDNADGDAARDVVSQIAPKARTSLDRPNQTLIVWATPDDLAKITSVLDEIVRHTGDYEDRAIRVYGVHPTRATAIATAINSAIPEARVSLVDDATTIVAWAKVNEHQRIADLIEQIDGDAGQQRALVDYSAEGLAESALQQAVSLAFPNVRTVVDTTTQRLLVWALPDEHAQIRGLIDELAKDAGETLRVPKSYPVESIDPSSAYSLIAPLVPAAQFTIDTTGRRLVASATPKQHARIADAIAAIDQPVGDRDQRLAVYDIESVTASSAQQAVNIAFPQLRTTVDSTARKLLVWADDAQHDKIRSVLDGLSDSVADSAPQPRVYQVRHIDVSAAYSVLATVIPQVRLTVDSNARSVIATATPEEHEQITQTLKDLDRAMATAQDFRLETYAVPSAVAADALNALQSVSATRPGVRVNLSQDGRRLIAWGSDEDHVRFQQIVDGVAADPQSDAPVVHTYRSEFASPSALAGLLQPIAPRAQITTDSERGAVIVAASAEDHALLRATVDSLAADEDHGTRPRLETYETEAIDADNLLNVLQNLYANRSDVRLSLDRATDRLVVWADDDPHATVARVIDQLRGDADLVQQRQLQLHELLGVDAELISSVLDKMFRSGPPAEIVEDPTGNTLLVLATPEQHATIDATLEQLQTASPEVEVIQLEYLDPFSAEYAIEELFDAGRRGSSDLRVDSDAETGQLFVRGTSEQVKQVRELLIKMGETSLADPDDPAQALRKLRMIPITGSDAASALEKLRTVWPRMRSNRLQFVTPSAVVPTLNRREAPTEETSSPKVPASPENDESPPTESQSFREPGVGIGGLLPGVDTAAQPPQESDEETAATETEAPASDDELPPIVISQGADGITIASDDIEALDQFERMLRALAGRTTSGGREMVILPLTNADAVTTADTLRELFREGFFGFASSSVKIVPDRRLNSLVVQADADDLIVIEQLLETLDTAEVPESALALRPRLIPIQHTDADEIADVLRDVYEEALNPARNRPPIQVPRGTSRDVSDLVEQLNQANQGPQLTLGVDNATNSLVVSANRQLFDEISELVEKLDQQAAESGSTIRVLRLKSVDTDVVERALELIKDGRRSRRR